MGAVVKQLGRGVVICRTIFIVVCILVVFEGRHPPLSAQQQFPPAPPPSAEMYALGVSSAVQQTRLDQIVQRLDIQKDTIAELRSENRQNSLDIAQFQGETRGIAGLLLLIQILTFVFQARKKPQ